MSRLKITSLSNQVYNRIINKYGEIKCHKCGDQLKVNQDIAIIQAAQRRPAKHYHLICAKKVNLI